MNRPRQRDRGPDPRSGSRLNAMFMSLLISGLGMMMTACVQDSIVFERFSTVTVDIDAPEPLSVAGIRVSLTGTGAFPVDSDFAFTDTDGEATIRTRVEGEFVFAVATHEDYELTYGGRAATTNFDFGQQALNLRQRGRMFLPPPGETISPDFLFPGSGIEPIPIPGVAECLGETMPQRLTVRPKRKGIARFVWFLENSRLLIQSFSPTLSQQTGQVHVTGSFNNFSMDFQDPVNGPIPLADDGCLRDRPPSGDDQGLDGVFTRLVEVEPGEVAYVFLINLLPVPVRDPYEERSKRVRVVINTPDRPGDPAITGIREAREIVASVMTVKDSSVPLVDRTEPDPPPDPNDPPSNFQ